MMRSILRASLLLTLILLVVFVGFAKSPAKSKKKHPKTTDEATASSSTTDAKTADSDTTSAPAAEAPAASAQAASTAKKSPSTDKAAPNFAPLAATTGTLGLFTTETADTLPHGAFSISAFGNRFDRMPGSVTILQTGIDAGYGVTDWLNLYVELDPWEHAHMGLPRELSLTPFNASNGLFPGQSFFPTVGATGLPSYVEDYPLINQNDGGIGPVTLGFKIGILSERRGSPVSLSLRNDFIIPTKWDLTKIENSGGLQTGQFNYLVSLAASKQWDSAVTATFNSGFQIVRDPRDDGQKLLNSADQFKLGAGFLFFPDHRFEPMMEYTGIIYLGGHPTPDYTYGARDPVDGVWGFRYYFTKSLGLDLGYRYMLNLKNADDRHGFVVKLGYTNWGAPPPPPPPPAPPTASCSADKSMVFVDSNDVVNVTATANSSAGLPLTYTWMSNGGRVDGSGPQVRWLSMGTTVGSYKISVNVDDGKGGAASCSVDVAVQIRPIRPPTISCSADRNTVFAGERVHITTMVGNPDNVALTYTWRANAGMVIGNGAAVDWDSTGLGPGSYTITVRVENSAGAADCSTTVQVQMPPPPPQASKISDCAFGKALSTRIDNVCKRVLDDVALRLQNEPSANIVIVGYSDPKERNGSKIAGDRAANAVKYLGEKGVAASRATTRTGAGQAGATDNRRIDVIWVPEGATY